MLQEVGAQRLHNFQDLLGVGLRSHMMFVALALPSLHCPHCSAAIEPCCVHGIQEL